MISSGRARPRLRIPDIAVRYVAEGTEAVGRLIDVSRLGLNVRTIHSPRSGAVVVVQFETPSCCLVDVRGTVRWNRTDGDAQIFGVRLHEPPRNFRDFVACVLGQSDKPDDELL